MFAFILFTMFMSSCASFSGEYDLPAITPVEFLLENMETPQILTDLGGKIRGVYGVAKIQIAKKSLKWIDEIHVNGQSFEILNLGQLGTIWIKDENSSPEKVLVERMNGTLLYENNVVAGITGICVSGIEKKDFSWIDEIHVNEGLVDKLSPGVWGTVWIKEVFRE